MNKSRLLGAVCACVFCFISMPSHAALINRGGGLIYDDVLNVTWLQDVNTIQGAMTWQQAQDSISSLVYHDSVRAVDWDDWRLPTVNPINGSYFDVSFSDDGTTDYGYNITGTASELSYMYYVNLGNIGRCLPTGSATSVNTCTENPDWLPDYLGGVFNTGPFTSLNTSAVYWTGTINPYDSTLAFNYVTGQGAQLFNTITGGSQAANFVWAVRDGDVVPIPPALWLFGSGLLGLIGMARRKA